MKKESRQNASFQESDYGMVVENNPDGSVQVRLPRREVCLKDARSKGICDQFDDNNMVLRVFNPVNAQQGDRVVVRYVSKPLAKSLFIVYLTPILALILGAIIGTTWNPFGNQNVSAVIGAIILLVICLGLIFGLHKRNIQEKGLDMPTITQILK